MSSKGFSARTLPQRNANANANATAKLKRRSDDRGRAGYPHQKRARTQTQWRQSQFPSENLNKVPLYHRNSSIPRVSHSYDSNVFGMSGTYVHGFGSDVSNNVGLSPVLRNINDVSVSLSVSSQPMTNNFSHQNLSGYYGTYNPQWASNPLPRQIQNDTSFDSLPEWNPDEPSSQTRNGFVPNVLKFNNFHVRSPNVIPYGSSDGSRYAFAASNGANAAPQIRNVYPMRTIADLPYSMRSNGQSPALLPPQVISPNPKQTLISNGFSDSLSKFVSGDLVSRKDDTWKQNTGINDGGGIIPTLGTEFDTLLLRARHESVINALYSDLPRQCSSCGIRFRSQEDHRNHMDWHVRKNRAAKETGKNTRQTQKPNKSRKWLASARLWLSAATGEPHDDEAVTALFNEADKEVHENEDEDFAVPADYDQKTCALCEEPFEDFFSDEADEWMFKGAVYLHMHDKQTETGTGTGMNVSVLGPIVHAKCMPQSRKASTQELEVQNLIQVSIPSARALVC